MDVKQIGVHLYHNKTENEAKPDIAPARALSGKTPNDAEIDIKRYLLLFYHRKWYILACIALALLVSFVLFKRQPEIYIATYQVYFKDAAKGIALNPAANIGPLSSSNTQFWLEKMNSQILAERMQLNMSHTFSSSQLRRMVRVSLPKSRDRDSKSSEIIYEVEVSHPDRDNIPPVMKCFVKSINEILLESQLEDLKIFMDYFSREISAASKELNELETRIGQIESADPSTLRDMNQVEAALSGFRTELMNIRIDLASVIAARARTELELQSVDARILNEVAFSEPLKISLMNLHVDLARELTTKNDAHPSIIAIRQNIEMIKAMLQDEIEQSPEIQSFQNNPTHTQLMNNLIDYRVNEISLQSRMQSVTQVIADLEAKLNPILSDTPLQLLLRERDLLKSKLELMVSKIVDAQSSAYNELSQFKLVDEPHTPQKASQKGLMMYLLVGLILGLGLSMGLIYLYDQIDNRIYLSRDISENTGLNVIGGIPRKSQGFERYHETYKDPANKKFRDALKGISGC